MFKNFSQRDPRWATIKLGSSSLTMGRYGCTTTCIADLSFYFGDNLTPDLMVKKIQYTKDGLIIWQSCDFSTFKFERREYGRSDKNIKSALSDNNRAVILEVDNSHWVVATSSLVTSYKIADPWFGDISTTKRYQKITGAAYFARK